MYNREYYIKNKEKIKKKRKNYYYNIVKNNPEKYKIMIYNKKEYNKTWKNKNKEYARKRDSEYYRQYHIKNKEKLKKKSKNYYHGIIKKNSEKYKIHIEKSRIWRKNNPNKIKEYIKVYNENHKNEKKRYYIENKEKYIKTANLWKKNNKEKVREIIRKENLKRKNKNIIHTFTVEQWIAKKNATNGICPSCNTFIGTDKLTLDHIFPIKKAEKGRVYTIEDVQPLCNSCNSIKHDKIIINEVIK